MVAWLPGLCNMFLALAAALAVAGAAAPAAAAQAAPSPGSVAVLRDVRVVPEGGLVRIGLVFEGTPAVHAVRTLDAPSLVLDASPVRFPERRRKLVSKGPLASELSFEQRDERTLRVTIRRASTAVPAKMAWRPAAGGAGTYWVTLGPAAGGAKKEEKKEEKKEQERISKSDAAPQRRRVVVIDAGHGGKDPGASGAAVQEKAVALAVALALARELAATPGVQVRLTRGDDRFLKLAERSQLASAAKAELFVSLHCNSCQNPRTQGLELYTLSRSGATDEQSRVVEEQENGVLGLEGLAGEGPADRLLNEILCDMLMTDTLNQSVRLAGSMAGALQGTPGVLLRGHREANFVVLRMLATPAVLVELGFLSNPREERLLMDGDHQRRLAQGLATGIRRWLQATGMRDGEYEPGPPVTYAVRPGDTLVGIAGRHGTTVAQLAGLNRLADASSLRAGQVLRVPADPVAGFIGRSAP